MQFASPYWLIGLIPWAAAAIYLLTGRQRRVIVPFIDLWPKTIEQTSRRWRLHLPLALAAMLAAMALAILAAAGPQVLRAAIDRPVVFIVDRGIGMSGRSGAERQFQTLVRSAANTILKNLGPGPATLISVPTGAVQTVDRAELTSQITALQPTAADTRAELTSAARAALQDDRAIVILFSNQSIDVENSRLVRIAPDALPAYVGIERLSVRAEPTPQAMVHIGSHLQSFSTSLTVAGAVPVAVTKPGDYFVDLPSAPDVVQATIEPGGDIDAADSAWAVRTSDWPRLEPRGDLPLELRRLVEVYSKNRPPQADSPAVAIVPLGESNERCAMTMTESMPGVSSPVAKIETAAEALAQGVDWQSAIHDAQIAIVQPPVGFTRLIWSGNQTLVAVRDGPVRQAWVGFRSTSWPATPEFVVFWTRLFDWLGASAPNYASSIAGEHGLPLWPGLYDHVAVNAAPVRWEEIVREDWPNHLAALANARGNAAFDFDSWLLVAAAGCLLAAALLR